MMMVYSDCAVSGNVAESSKIVERTSMMTITPAG
jgi:hypothetical protein